MRRVHEVVTDLLVAVWFVFLTFQFSLESADKSKKGHCHSWKGVCKLRRLFTRYYLGEFTREGKERESASQI